MNILIIGDVVGRPGRGATKLLLAGLRKRYALDLVIVNGDNAAGGRGLTSKTAVELLEAGADVITSGNHIWNQKEVLPHLDSDLPIVRPLNYPPGVPGRGWVESKGVVVVNLMARVFVGEFDCPFRAFDQLVGLREVAGKIIVVDLHGEATSEKTAFGWYADGRAAAVLGTHTHVPTADNRVLPRGTAYVSDVGMVGPRDSVIGVNPDTAVRKFLTQIPTHLTVAEGGPVVFNSVLVEIDEGTRLARSIVRIDREVPA
ncbi:MAG: TIGR00282 family metallophosphoesterase [Chloroflexota bacterium]|nr:MAG: TIGR00282 family metallophosphoesterase [Chloroflexota bacterium]